MNSESAMGKGLYNTLFDTLYPFEECEYHRRRWQDLIKSHSERNGDHNPKLFSSPGRTEIAGNHTDHNGGKVLAASIHLDTIAAVSTLPDRKVILCSKHYESVSVDLADLRIQDNETGKTDALIRGIAAGIVDRGGTIGGFDASITSRVLKGSGLSSSAALEILIACIFNELYNDGRFSILEMARMGQKSENRYFGKPCGLMDQLACASGTALTIDCLSSESPEIQPISVDFSPYDLVVVDSRANHADLTDEYSSIPGDMLRVARALGATRLGQINQKTFHEKQLVIRNEVGDRALMRAQHFYHENKRVTRMAELLREGRIEDFLHLIRESGNSSWRFLQNVIVPTSSMHQELAYALMQSEEYLAGRGASRVHGGGFGGTMLAFVARDELESYTRNMERIFGEGTVLPLYIRNRVAGELRLS